jgi:hypothetical protein
MSMGLCVAVAQHHLQVDHHGVHLVERQTQPATICIHQPGTGGGANISCLGHRQPPSKRKLKRRAT